MSQNNILLEIAAFTPESALTAWKSGVDRIELCSGYSEGGLSPSVSVIKLVRRNVDCKLHTMIRPRIGDFIYTEFEKQIILDEIEYNKVNGVDGIVVGALTQNGDIDEDFVKTIVEKAYPLSVTFHRAFDLSKDLLLSLNKLMECGINRVLTSGGKKCVFEGQKIISELVKQAANNITILPGGGITSENVTEIINTTKAKEIHFSGKLLKESKMKPISTVKLSSTTIVDDYKWFECDYNAVKEMIAKLKEC